jgi:hypothetical protein
VTVEKSRAEIELLLKKNGATAFFSASDEKTGSSMVGFKLAERMFRLEVRTPRREQAPKKKQAPVEPALTKPKKWESAREKTLREERDRKLAAEYARELAKHEKSEGDRAAHWIAAEERRRWRAQLLLVKAKLEMIATGDSTVEREFLADMLMPNGKTVGSQALPALAESYRTGTAPWMPMLGSGE